MEDKQSSTGSLICLLSPFSPVGVLPNPVEYESYSDELRARPWIRVELFSTLIRSAPLQGLSGYGEIPLTFPGGLFRGGG